jgi:hypothetical protein
MFYLARLTSSSSHSLAATIGYASGGALGWRARLEPRGGLTAIRVPFPAASPAAAPHSNPQQQRRFPAWYRLFRSIGGLHGPQRLSEDVRRSRCRSRAPMARRARCRRLAHVRDGDARRGAQPERPHARLGAAAARGAHPLVPRPVEPLERQRRRGRRRARHEVRGAHPGRRVAYGRALAVHRGHQPFRDARPRRGPFRPRRTPR